MRNADQESVSAISHFSASPWLLSFYALVLCCAGILISDGAQARVTTGDQIIKLHLPVNLEGRQTIRLRRLVDEYYDIDLEDYVLREVVIETDGASERRNAYASLQVGRYKTRRVSLNNNLTSLEAPDVYASQWRLSLGAGARAHGILLVLSERTYSNYRSHPHIGASLGLGWYLGSRDYYYHDRYARPHFFNRYHRDHRNHYRGTWNGSNRLRYPNNRNRSQWRQEQRRHEQQRQRALNRERRQEQAQDRSPKRDAEHRQWRGDNRSTARRQTRQRTERAQRNRATERAARIQQRPDRVQQRRVRTQESVRTGERAKPRARSNRQQPRSSASRSERSAARSKVERPSRQRTERAQRSTRSERARSGSDQNRGKRVRM